MTITDLLLVRLMHLFYKKKMVNVFNMRNLCNDNDNRNDNVIHFIPPQDIVPDIRGVQVLVVFILISAYELGPGPISWFIGSELFDQPARSIAMAFTSMLNWGGKFLLALLFPPLLVCRFYPLQLKKS